MNEKANNSDQRAEDMLRRWGAAEAVREVKVPPIRQVNVDPPDNQPPPRLRSSAVHQVLVAAAGVLLIAAGIVFVLTRVQPSKTRAETQEISMRVAELESELAGAQSALQKAQADQTSAEAALAGEKQAAQTLEQQVKDLKESLRSQRAVLAERDARHKALEAKLTIAQMEITAVSEDAKRTEADRTAAVKKQREITGDLTRIRERMAALVQEVTRLRKMNDKAEATGRELRAELTTLKARHAGIILDSQRAYLAVGSSGEAGVKMRQVVSRRARMIERYSQLRGEITDSPTARLLDRLEVMLTRLKLLDPGDVDAGEAFAEMFTRSGLEGEIDKALRAGLAGPAVRAWIFEVKLILVGAGRAA